VTKAWEEEFKGKLACVQVNFVITFASGFPQNPTMFTIELTKIRCHSIVSEAFRIFTL